MFIIVGCVTVIALLLLSLSSSLSPSSGSKEVNDQFIGTCLSNSIPLASDIRICIVVLRITGDVVVVDDADNVGIDDEDVVLGGTMYMGLLVVVVVIEDVKVLVLEVLGRIVTIDAVVAFDTFASRALTSLSLYVETVVVVDNSSWLPGENVGSSICILVFASLSFSAVLLLSFTSLSTLLILLLLLSSESSSSSSKSAAKLGLCDDGRLLNTERNRSGPATLITCAIIRFTIESICYKNLVKF
uniref:Uncharacterized protein n=1 Tax=Glossina brevipalpis TaxID=37001 RepID=A0A1A9X0C3_9MUSC